MCLTMVAALVAKTGEPVYSNSAKLYWKRQDEIAITVALSASYIVMYRI